MKKFCLLFVMLFSCLTIIAEGKNDVPINPENPNGGNSGGRSVVLAPSASLDASALSIAYPLDAVSIVQIVDETTNVVVYSGSFGATRLVVIDLEEEGLTTGNYCLRIFVFGEWWRGYFEINE